jgi:Cof subfamily protein (haloacid dehalogenase superfamily)
MTRARSRPIKCSAVISDVDGTLVTNEKVLTERTKAAAAALRANGILFSIISSRPPRGLRMLIAPLGITAPIVGFNGGMLATADLTVVSAHLLPSGVARRIVDMLARRVEVWIFSGQDWLVRHPDGPYVGLEERTVGFGPTIVDDFGPAFDAAAKIVGVSADFEHLARCEGELRGAVGEQASVVRSQPYYLDVTHPLANKGDALIHLARLLKVPLAEVVAIGDGHNDIAMFERSGFRIAMGNASPDVQRAADFVTGSNSEDGFAQAVEQLVLALGRSSRQEVVAKGGDRVC